MSGLKSLSTWALLFLCAGAVDAQSIPPVGSSGANSAALPQALDPDQSAGRCQSEIITSYQPVPATNTKKAIFYFPWHSAYSECEPGSVSSWCQCVWRGKPGDPRPATSCPWRKPLRRGRMKRTTEMGCTGESGPSESMREPE